jgi:hypothetical protein
MPSPVLGVYALAMGEIALEAGTNEPNLPQRLEQAYFGNTQRPIGMSGQLWAQEVTGAT